MNFTILLTRSMILTLYNNFTPKRFMRPIIICIVLFINSLQLCQSNNKIAYNIPDPDCTGIFNLCVDIDKERLGREAIKLIHEQMDDDKDGMVEASESSDFIKEELELQTDYVRHRHFQNATLQITYNDLWTQWHNSAVYNWTNDDVINWLVKYVHLPMYVENFRRNQLDGRMIPRLAANQRHYLSAIMHIRDPRHKRRLIIKATDVVLFGPPQNTHNVIKEMILTSALFISIGACLYAYLRHRKTQEAMKSMLKELETLQKAEGDLISVTGKMKAMENELKDKTKVDRSTLNSWYMQVQQIKEEADKCYKQREMALDQENQLRFAVKEIEKLRNALYLAEEHAQCQSYEPPNELIDLLKRTYHVEELAFETKRKSAEAAMFAAKEQMIKISKMQKGFLGAVRIAHTNCMDNISELISGAKLRLTTVQDEYEEREKRWNRIASLLDRDDLISHLSSSTTSVSGNQYLGGVSHVQLNNGITNMNTTTDSNTRIKRGPADTSNLLSANTDSSSMRKVNSNGNMRGSATSSSMPTTFAQLDTKSETDHSLEYSASPMTLKRRIITSNTLTSDRSSTERLINASSLAYSHSINGLNNLDNNSTRTSTAFDCSDTSSILTTASACQTKAFAGTISDYQSEQVDSIFSDNLQSDSISQISDFCNDDQHSAVVPEIKMRQAFKNRIFKSFVKKSDPT